MKIGFLYIGKTDLEYLRTGITGYFSRIVHYCPFEVIEIPDIKFSKNLTEQQQKDKEGDLILSKVDKSKILILLDEKGKEFSSESFATFIEKRITEGGQDMLFVIGGPYGFSEAVYNRANYKIALSQMTFSHQMVRLIFAEQLYRAFTIIKGEPYHHR